MVGVVCEDRKEKLINLLKELIKKMEMKSFLKWKKKQGNRVDTL